jgi:uncharacterized cupin superfamily protein
MEGGGANGLEGALMQATIVPGVSMWSVWQPDRNFFFNSFFVRTPEGNAVIDPLPCDDALFDEIEGDGGAQWVVITNRDHERAAPRFVERFGARVAASAIEAPLLGLRVDRELADDDLLLGMRVVAFRGLKTPGEIALDLPFARTIIVGDALWGDPAGSLRVMPAAKLEDPAAAVLSLRALRARAPLHLLVGDGACIFSTATDALQRALEAQGGVFVHRVNIDELALQHREYGRFRSDHAEIGFLIGAERLGYRLARLEPGDIFAPLHWHSLEEELFIVWEGTPSIRTPQGTWPLRRGDLVAFPTREAGAHQLINESAGPATLILIGLQDELDDCFYPDSHKALIGKRDLIVRDTPALGYYDGET